MSEIEYGGMRTNQATATLLADLFDDAQALWSFIRYLAGGREMTNVLSGPSQPLASLAAEVADLWERTGEPPLPIMIQLARTRPGRVPQIVALAVRVGLQEDDFLSILQHRNS